MQHSLANHPTAKLADPDLQRRIAELRQTDNVRSWFYLAREYAFLAAVIGAALCVFELVYSGSAHWLWGIVALIVAVPCIGAGQHRLATLTHEASHYMLFKNRLLNELVSEWFCMFPLLGSTHRYRVQHLGHHQYPNDPVRDPDWDQLTQSGHKFHFPMSRGQFLRECVFKQLRPRYLLRYIIVRALYKVDRDDGGKYRFLRRGSPRLALFGLAYHVALIAWLVVAVRAGDLTRLWLGTAALAAFALAVYSLLPERLFAEFAIKPDLSVRTISRLRLTFNTCVLVAVASLTLATSRPWGLYFFLLWLMPLGTAFAFFMILRQLVQHGNADGARFTNTRVFLVHPLISLSVFPIGNDFHLPHHLYPMVPHYRLRELHELLMQATEYRQEATIVHGYFRSPETPPVHPTVVDVMTN